MLQLKMEDAGQNYLKIAPASNCGCRLQELRGGHTARDLREQESQGE